MNNTLLHILKNWFLFCYNIHHYNFFYEWPSSETSFLYHCKCHWFMNKLLDHMGDIALKDLKPRQVLFFKGSCTLIHCSHILSNLKSSETLYFFSHFKLTNFPQCSQSNNSLMYVYFLQIPTCFLWVLDQSSFHFGCAITTQKGFPIPPVSISISIYIYQIRNNCN